MNTAREKMAITLRPAGDEDAPLLLAWRNDPATRAQSRRQRALSWTELIEAPPGTRRETLVALRDGVAVGSIRFDIAGAECELSWTVAPEWRGRGIGAELVVAAVEAAPLVDLVAEIRPDNQASRQIAEKAGFVFVGMHEGLEVWRMDKDSSSSPRKRGPRGRRL